MYRVLNVRYTNLDALLTDTVSWKWRENSDWFLFIFSARVWVDLGGEEPNREGNERRSCLPFPAIRRREKHPKLVTSVSLRPGWRVRGGETRSTTTTKEVGLNLWMNGFRTCVTLTILEAPSICQQCRTATNLLIFCDLI